jgi:hypothetical protein
VCRDNQHRHDVQIERDGGNDDIGDPLARAVVAGGQDQGQGRGEDGADERRVHLRFPRVPVLIRRDRQDTGGIEAELGAVQQATERVDQRDRRRARQRRGQAHRHFARPEHRHPEVHEEGIERTVLPGSGEIADQHAKWSPRQYDRVGLVEPEALRPEAVEAQEETDREEAAEQDEVGRFRALQRRQPARDRPVERRVPTRAAATRSGGRTGSRGHRPPFAVEENVA